MIEMSGKQVLRMIQHDMQFGEGGMNSNVYAYIHGYLRRSAKSGDPIACRVRVLIGQSMPYLINNV